ncbi:MAG: DMT family transporter [Pseudomonadota bacterium]
MIATTIATISGLSPNARGALWVAVGGFFFTVMVALIKEIGDEVPVVQILFFRQVVMMLTVAPVLAANYRVAFRTKHVKLHAARVVLAMIAMVLGFTAVVHLPLAEATALGFSKTMFVTLFAVYFLHELAGPRRWIVVIVGFIGVLVMLRPGLQDINLYAILVLISAMAAGAIMVIIRKVAQDDHPVTILSIQAVFVGLLMGVPCAIFWVTPTLEQWVAMGVIGVVSAVGQYCNIRGFRSGEASAVAPMEYLRLVFAIILGLLLFAEVPDIITLIGALLIAGSSIYAIRAEHAEQASDV